MTIDSLTAIICWIAVIWGMFRIDLRSRRAIYSFVTFVCITLVATFRNPSVAYVIDRLADFPDLGRMLSYLATTGTATSWALVCLSLAPPVVQRRRWLLGLAPLTVVVLLFLWAQEIGSGQPVQEYLYRTNNFSVAMTLFAQAYLFAILIGIGMPTLIYNFMAETSPALRLRLTMLTSTQIFAAIMTGTVIGIYTLVINNALPRDYQSPMIMVLMVLTALSYAFSLVPVKLYTHLALLIEHLRQLRGIRPIRRLERRTARLLGLTPRPIHFSDAVNAPDYTEYQLVISIVDRRKSLRATPTSAAQAMADILDEICNKTSNYHDLVKQFQHAGHRL